MKASEVEVGALYSCRVSGKLTTVKIATEQHWMYRCESHKGGWHAINIATGRAVYIKSAARLRATAQTPAQE